MTSKKVFELGEKFAQQAEKMNDNAKYQAQRERIDKFSHKLLGELKAINNEMGGDYLALKEKQLDPKVLEVLRKTRLQLIEKVKDIDPLHPYEGTNHLINWADSRIIKSTLDNLNFIIHSFLNNNQDDFKPSSMVKPLRIDSIKKLQNLLKAARIYMNENPLLRDPRNQSTVPPPVLRNVKNDEETVPAGREDVTVPGIPASKKEVG